MSHPAEIPYQAIVEQAVAGVYVLQDESFAYCNSRWAQMIGYERDEVIGASMAAFAPPGFLPELMDLYYRRLNANPSSMHFVTRIMHRDGIERRLEVHGSRIEYGGRPAVMGVGIDITERLRSEDELRRSRQQLRELSAYTAGKLEEQRLSFARDVHDVLGGILTSIRMDATRLLRRAPGPELKMLTEGLIKLSLQGIEAVRAISAELRPFELDHLSLESVIAQELVTFSARFNVECHMDLQPVPPSRLPPRRGNAIYRIFQESLTNVARHARARNVRVRLAVFGDELLLRLDDDGVGFESTLESSKTLGLLSMRERAAGIGARLDFLSTPGSGTEVRLSVPLI